MRHTADKLAIRFETLDINEAYDVFERKLAPIFAGLERNVAEENLQARLRGNTLMALSNKLGALVLTTGNKSETAVGYCTLYGDMAGGLAVLADVPKTLVYELCRVVNRRHPDAISESVMTKPPSAELSPDQKDTDSLPPYEILDPILKVEGGGDWTDYLDAATVRSEYRAYMASEDEAERNRLRRSTWRAVTLELFHQSMRGESA